MKILKHESTKHDRSCKTYIDVKAAKLRQAKGDEDGVDDRKRHTGENNQGQN